MIKLLIGSLILSSLSAFAVDTCSMSGHGNIQCDKDSVELEVSKVIVRKDPVHYDLKDQLKYISAIESLGFDLKAVSNYKSGSYTKDEYLFVRK